MNKTEKYDENQVGDDYGDDYDDNNNVVDVMICSFNLTFVVDFFQVVVIKNGSETGKLAVIQQKVDDVSNSCMMSMMMWVIEVWWAWWWHWCWWW